MKTTRGQGKKLKGPIECHLEWYDKLLKQLAALRERQRCEPENRELMQEILNVTQQLDQGTDWLMMAIARVGSVSKAAKIMGVSRPQVYKFLREGLGDAPLGGVAELARRTDVDLKDLVRTRLGPFRSGPSKAHKKR